MKTAIEILSILSKAQISFTRKTSIWGSEYWTVKGQSYRISDHDKPAEYVNYSDTIYCDNFDQLYNLLNVSLDLSDKSVSEIEFKNNLILNQEMYCGELCYNVNGHYFNELECALNYAWRTR
jgi:hypothetical protein